MENTTEAEKELRKPILELQVTPQTRVSFFNLDQFTSPGLRTLRVHEIPPVIKNLVVKTEEKDRNEVNTYNKTTAEPESSATPKWQRTIYGFVNNYIRMYRPDILEKIGENNLSNLSPKKAIDLTVMILKDLTKYQRSDTTEARKALGSKSPTEADQSTVLELLQDGLENRSNPSWEGNGVCRNFAWMGKAVFESIRDTTPNSPLSTSYALYEGGYVFAPKRDKKYNFGRMDPSHAWNNFIVIDPTGNVEITVVDFTWAGKDSDGNIVNLDHTRERIEPLVYELASRIEGDESQRNKQLQKIFEYYADNIQNPGDSGYSDSTDFKLYFAMRALNLIRETKSYITVPESLKTSLIETYKELGSQADIGEIGALWELMPGTATFDEILESYLKKLNLSSNYNELYSTDDRLQRLIFRNIEDRPDFDDFMKRNPAMRVRLRQVKLGHWLLPFDPSKRIEDVRELKYLLDRSQILKTYFLSSTDLPDEKRLASLYQRVRTDLKERNPEILEEQIAKMSDYDIIANFDNLLRQKG